MAMVSVADQRTALIAIMETVTGVTRSYPYRPDVLNSAELIATIAEPLIAPYNNVLYGSGSLTVERPWDLLWILSAVGTAFRFADQQLWDTTQNSALTILAPYQRVFLGDGRAFGLTLLRDGGPRDTEIIGDTTYRVLRLSARTETTENYQQKTRPAV